MLGAMYLDFPLTYPRGYGWGGTPQNTGWYPWQSQRQLIFGMLVEQHILEPMLSDIEFDLDGSMVLALMDRTAHQSGAKNYDDPTFSQHWKCMALKVEMC